ncbi:MAG TPA: hypothetical protein PLX05_12000 [Acinetobacter parvus]|uniref:hypothetical protein n=1 Tax=Acinetobacter parvus TaxID=134533 RepID=UPI002C3F86D9|nr:hypothetical protein [Acinetobacter parvus]HRM16300.1 hypothetical protein [Acinetobacter parvus]
MNSIHTLRRRSYLLGLYVCTIVLAACGQPPKTEAEQVPAKIENITKSDLKAPPPISQNETAPAAPTVSYESLYVSDEGVGYDQIFALESLGEDTMGQAINYQSKVGRVNVMEQVVEDVEVIGYVHINYAYKFTDQYVLIVSTGENGNSCPATTYAFSYDTKSESVTGKTEIDGCSENVQAFADGNKLIVKKDGKSTTIYNGKV